MGKPEIFLKLKNLKRGKNKLKIHHLKITPSQPWPKFDFVIICNTFEKSINDLDSL